MRLRPDSPPLVSCWCSSRSSSSPACSRLGRRPSRCASAWSKPRANPLAVSGGRCLIIGALVQRGEAVKTRLLKGAALAAGLLLALAAWADKPDNTPPGHTDADVILINGNIHTMDGQGSIARGVGIRDGRFIEVTNGRPHAGPRTRVIDLQGRTVVPGMIEAHVHFVSLAIRPGYHVVIEKA